MFRGALLFLYCVLLLGCAMTQGKSAAIGAVNGTELKSSRKAIKFIFKPHITLEKRPSVPCEETTEPQFIFIRYSKRECQVNQFNCHPSGACIDRRLRCNFISDCPRGEDEKGCVHPVVGTNRLLRLYYHVKREEVTGHETKPIRSAE